MGHTEKAGFWNVHERPHADLREAIERFEAAGELRRIRGASWKLEMGTLAEIVYREPEPPAILFEDIPGYPKGFRAISGSTNSAKRLAITLGFPVPSHPLDVVRAYRDRMKTHKPIPPRVVTKGAVLENILSGKEIDVLKFPAPMLHEHDGGRYIGTDDLVIMRDPEENWVNCGTYRSMVQGPDKVGLWISPGKHGRQIRDKYFKRGKPCPVLISCGHDPLLFLAGGNEIRFGLSEYDYAAGHRGLPYDVVESERYRLPMPAHAEIVLEGAMHPGETMPEGPFGEFTGDGAAVGLLLFEVRDEGRHDLGRGRARRPSRRERRVGARARLRAHVQCDLDQAELRRPLPPGRAPCRRLPVGLLPWALRRRGGRGHRSHESRAGDLGDVHALRPGRGHRFHPPRLERAARPAPAERRAVELARHHRRLPALRDAG